MSGQIGSSYVGAHALFLWRHRTFPGPSRRRLRGAGPRGHLAPLVTDDRQDAGDTRILRTGRSVSRERIVELIDDRRFVYDNLGGPFRSYRGTVDLAPASGGGTHITWSAVFVPKIPFLGGFWTWYLTRFMQRMADGLAAYTGSGGRHGA
uniref:SRPBCC family protein n=1 Tax=Herbidospora sakaeratensis TaxID=564415 RepID=UPI000B09D7D6|nr:SRPBCC family protein [Herbidospora sakaeratensis]